ncbi:MAG: peptidoglycan editing factor PgeF [Proteobacteria bacterium]|nr:peptidoglycan editing factor PgeF [Pseudomonadota bacterium]
MIVTETLNRSDRVRHAFFSRLGGISEGIFASLNCGFGSGDNPDHIAANRANAMRRLAPDLGLDGGSLLTLYQVHSAKAVVVETPWKPGEAPQADAAVTKIPGIALGILTADCAPLLLADAAHGVIGAAHAGWKGALGGVVEATVSAMIGLGAEKDHIEAAIGPCIQQASYEVGAEFLDRFMDDDPANRDFFIASSRDGHFMFDLPAYLGRKLDHLGVAFETVGRDTCADEGRFFSYRRATQHREKDYGRGLAAILLRDI